MHLIQVFRPALADGVEAAHGIQFVSKELGTDGLLHLRGEHVQNTATDGKLTHALHLLAPGVAGGGQGLGHFVQVITLPHLEGAAHQVHGPGGKGALHQALYRGNQQGNFVANHAPQQAQSAVFPLAGHGGGVMEGEAACA